VNIVYPDKLKPNDEIRVIAPARSLKILSEQLKIIANDRIKDLGYKLSFGNMLRKLMISFQVVLNQE